VETWEELSAILSEHLPSELLGRARQLADALVTDALDQDFLELARLYRALVALVPGHTAQIQAAYQATVFSDDRNDAEDWEQFEKVGHE
jgi:hypothetical protein